MCFRYRIECDFCDVKGKDIKICVMLKKEFNKEYIYVWIFLVVVGLYILNSIIRSSFFYFLFLKCSCLIFLVVLL